MTIHFTLDGRALTATEGTTILEAAQANGCDIPTLCHLPGIELAGGCGICAVEQEQGELINSCSTTITEGAIYHTRSPAVMSRRREVTQLLLSRHEPSCQVCDRHGDCELERLLGKLNISEATVAGLSFTSYHDRTSAALSLNGDRCLACGRCVAVCSEKQGLNALRIDPELLQVVPISEYGLATAPCIGCGQCTLVCPAGALMPRSSVATVESTLISRERYSVAILEPAAAASLMSELKLSTLPQLIGILHKLGFQEVVDAAWGADLYLTKLAEDFNADDKPIQLLNRDPTVERYLRQNRPDLLELIPSVAPPARLAALTWRRFIATEQGLPPGHCYLVQITTETGDKESLSHYSALARERGLDAALTVRELTSLIKRLRLDLLSTKPRFYSKLRGSTLGSLLGIPGGTAVGFLELLARQGREKPILGNKNYLLPTKETKSLTMPGGCPAVVRIAHGMKAVVSTIENAEKLAQEDPNVVQLLDLSASPGGNLGGGGLHRLANDEELQLRYQALLFLAEGASVRSPHQNRLLRRYLPKHPDTQANTGTSS